MLYRPVECVTGMDRDCGSILKIWDVARSLKLNCAPFWTAMEDTSHCPGSQCVWPKQAAESTGCT
ncbi:hypothetical protein Gotur_016010 [Gossypium turneri]